MLYLVLYIRDFPHFHIGWRGSYFITYSTEWDIKEVTENTKKDIKESGGKYGAIIYHQGRELKKFNQKGEPC